MKSLLALLLLCLFTAGSYCQSTKAALLQDSLPIITKRVETSILKGRYMEGKLITAADTLKDWEGILVSLYEYKDETGHLARVWLADADAKKIATWVITTCFIVTGKCDYKNSMSLITEINKASNGQFPVLGVVFEDGAPYIFKDGVTVHVNTPLTDYTDLSLVNETNINKTMKYGRIISTTREEYNALFPAVNTTDHHWREVVRTEYKKALASDENNLIIAWAKGKLQ